MKKFFYGFLALILVVGIGAAVYFVMFSTPANQKMTIAEARALVNTVCVDMGFIEDENGADEMSAANQMSIEYDDYESDEMYYKGYDDFYKAFLMMAKFAFEYEDITEKIHYSSTASYDMYGGTYTSTGHMYFELEKNRLHLFLYQGDSTEVTIVIDNSPNANNKWTMYFGSLTTNLKGDPNSVIYGFFEAGIEKVYRVGIYDAKITKDTLGNFVEEDLEYIEKLYLFEIDLNTHKRLDLSNNQLTSAETIEQTNILINKIKQLPPLPINSISEAEFTEIDFMEKLYKHLGYID